MTPLFKKPDNMKYTDMCIWIDNNAYREDCDETKFVEYTYHIIKMLAYIGKYFNDPDVYEDFTLFGTMLAFNRYHNKKQFKYKEDGTPCVKRVTSILNYLKQCLYFWKIQYEQQTYSQINQTENPSNPTSHKYITPVHVSSHLSQFEMEDYMKNLKSAIYKYLSNIPEVSSGKEWKNIYISCFLTLSSAFTLPQRYYLIYRKCGKNPTYIENNLHKLTRMCEENCVTLYHLDESKKDYIKVLCRKLKKHIAKELSEIISSYEEPEDISESVFLEGFKESFQEVDDGAN